MTEPIKITEENLQVLVKKLEESPSDWKGEYSCGDWVFSKTIDGKVGVRVLRDSCSDDVLTGYQQGLGYRIDMYRDGKLHMTSGWKGSDPICNLYNALTGAHEHQRQEKERKKELENSDANRELSDFVSSNTQIRPDSRSIAEICSDARADVAMAEASMISTRALLISHNRTRYIESCMDYAARYATRLINGHTYSERYIEEQIKDAETVVSNGESKDIEALIRGYQKITDIFLTDSGLCSSRDYVEKYKKRIQQLKKLQK